MASKKYFEVLIKKLYDNKASVREIRKLFESLRSDNNLDGNMLPGVMPEELEKVDRSDNFEKIWMHIDNQIDPVQETKKVWLRPFIRTAAAVALIIVVGFALGKIYQAFTWTQYTTQVGEIRTIQLSDGTSVVLNGNSALEVKRNLSVYKPRDVYLTGEANFEVTKARTEDARFIVHTEDLNVEVLGTRFNVNSRDSETVVYLEEGRVKVSPDSRTKEELFLSPGEKVEYSSSEPELKLIEVASEVNEISWREGLFEFKDLPLEKILKQITDPYNYSYDIVTPRLGNRTFTVRIPDNDLDFAISVLDKLTGTVITDQDGTLIVRENENNSINN